MVTKDDSKISVCIKAVAAVVAILSVFAEAGGGRGRQDRVAVGIGRLSDPRRRDEGWDRAPASPEEGGCEQRLCAAS